MLKRDFFVGVLIFVLSVVVVYLLQAYHLLYAMRYLIAVEAIICALTFGAEAWQCEVSWRGKGKLYLSLLPFICVLLLLLPFSSLTYLSSENQSTDVISTISVVWEAGCGCLLFWFTTLFAIKVQKFYTEIATVEVLHFQE
jgi:hypothetical protein